MLNFPFYCPACNTVAEAAADPVALLFGGKSDLVIKCGNCEAQFRGDVQVGRADNQVGSVVIKDRLPDAE